MAVVMETPAYSHDRPIDEGFYGSLRHEVPATDWGWSTTIHPAGASMVSVPAGSLVSFELLGRAQIVNVFFWNSDDPDERYWAHETSLLEGAFLRPFTRLWSTMARFRPLATVIEDTVVAGFAPQPAPHHFVMGGSGTPADWVARGGAAGVVSSWGRLAAAMETVGLPSSMLTENVSLFQKTAVDPVAQTITVLPSDALPGDRVVWFAEVDLTLAIALSPFGAGGGEVLDGETAPVAVRVQPDVAVPLGWPYPEVAYPDLSLYLGEDGRRSEVVGPTPGIAKEAL